MHTGFSLLGGNEGNSSPIAKNWLIPPPGKMSPVVYSTFYPPTN